MAGVAPGGVVAVWVVGAVSVEVFFGQAEKAHLDPSRAFGLPFKDKQEADTFIAKQLPNSLHPKRSNRLKGTAFRLGSGLWARYRNRYAWTPVILKAEKPAALDSL